MKGVLKLLFHPLLKKITTNCCSQYINHIKCFAVKACYNVILVWWDIEQVRMSHKCSEDGYG